MNKLTIKEIKERSYKKHNNIIANYIERPLSYYFIWLLYPIGITGNQVSLFSIFFMVVPLTLIIVGKPVIGTFLLLFISILDCVDGGMAKCRKNKTKMGKYLEYTFHEICTPALFFALSIYSFRYFNNYIMLILGTITVFSIFLVNVCGKNKELLIPKQSITKFGGIKNNGIITKVIILFNGQGNMYYIMFLLSIFGLLQYAIIFYSLFYSSIAVVKFLTELGV